MVALDEEEDMRSRGDTSPVATALGASMGDMGDIDVSSLDDETQRFVLETHMENMGLMDFLGFELANLATQYSTYDKLPKVESVGKGGFGKMGDMAAFVTTIKSFVGLGVLTLPYAATKGGYVLGPLGMVVVAFLSHHCMELLLELGASLKGKTASFGSVALQTSGRWAKVLVDYCLILTQYGFAIADLLFIVENVRDVVCFETQNTACPTKSAICVGVVLCLMPFTWLRTLDVLTVPVLLSNVALLCGISWVYYWCFVQIGTSGIAPNLVAFNWQDVPVFFGCAVFSFEGVGLVLPIQHAMQHPTHFPGILRQCMLILGTLFSTFCLVGYAAYGEGTDDIILFSIPQNKITSFLRLFYCLGVFFTYPVMLFPVYGVTESKLRCLRDTQGWGRRVAFRSTLVAFTGIIGMQIPHFGLFLGLIGSVACSLLAFVLPALFHLRRPDRSNASWRGDVKDVSLMAFGIIAGSISFVLTLKELLNSPSEEGR